MTAPNACTHQTYSTLPLWTHHRHTSAFIHAAPAALHSSLKPRVCALTSRHPNSTVTLSSRRTRLTCTASPPPTKAKALVDDLLQRVEGTDGGQNVSSAARTSIDELIHELELLGKSQSPMEDPRLFGQYRVAYTSTTNKSPPAGGLFRSRIGKLLFRTRGLFQHVFRPDTVVNLVCFRVLGLLKGCVSLRGKLAPLEDDRLGPNAIQVMFEKPRLCFGSAVFQFGPVTQVKLATTYLDDRVRLAVGNRGSLFVFVRGGEADSKIASEWNYVYQAQPLPALLLPLGAALAVALTFLAPIPVRITVVALAILFALVLKRGGTNADDPSVVREN